MSQNDANSLLDTACLSIGYGEKGPAKTLASGLDLTLHAGEFICLPYPNGAGKTTLLRTFSGISLRWPETFDCRDRPLRNPNKRASPQNQWVALADKVPAGMMNARSLVALGRTPIRMAWGDSIQKTMSASNGPCRLFGESTGRASGSRIERR